MFGQTLWMIDPTLLSLTAGDDIACIATVTDSLGDSTTESASATFADTPPTITSAAEVDVALVEVGDAVTCSMTATDAEDGVLTPSYEWFVGGKPLALVVQTCKGRCWRTAAALALPAAIGRCGCSVMSTWSAPRRQVTPSSRR